MSDRIVLADGRSVPKNAVDSLAELDRSWPGATLPQARPAIVAAVIAALTELQSDAGPASGSYAAGFCRGGCDCSCCYGMADEPCHCRDVICNCGGDRAAHGQKPLEES